MNEALKAKLESMAKNLDFPCDKDSIYVLQGNDGYIGTFTMGFPDSQLDAQKVAKAMRNVAIALEKCIWERVSSICFTQISKDSKVDVIIRWADYPPDEYLFLAGEKEWNHQAIANLMEENENQFYEDWAEYDYGRI